MIRKPCFSTLWLGLLVMVAVAPLVSVEAAANIRVLHSIRDSSGLAKTIDECFYSSFFARVYVAGAKVIASQSYGTTAPNQATSRYVAVPAGSQNFEVYQAGTTTQMLSTAFVLVDGGFYTVTLGRVGSDYGTISANLWQEDHTSTTMGTFRFRVINIDGAGQAMNFAFNNTVVIANTVSPFTVAGGGYTEYNTTNSYQVTGRLTSNPAVCYTARVPAGDGNAALYADDTAYTAIYFSAWPFTLATVLTDAALVAPTTAPTQTTTPPPPTPSPAATGGSPMTQATSSSVTATSSSPSPATSTNSASTTASSSSSTATAATVSIAVGVVVTLAGVVSLL